MSRITVLIGSQRKGGNTETLANSFCNGAIKHNTVKIFSVAELKINPCTGCNACQISKAAGFCCQQDDMPIVYDALCNTDILVIASPVYFYGLSAQLSAIINRLHTPYRKMFPIKKLGLLLVAADTTKHVFDAVKMQYRLTLEYFHLESIGEICVGGVEAKGAITGNEALWRTEKLGTEIR